MRTVLPPSPPAKPPVDGWRFRWNLVAPLAFVLATSEGATATEPPTSGPPAETVAQAHALLEKEIAPHVPGLAAAVAVDGWLVWSEAFGFADLEAQRPVTSASRFRIGSISKSLTAAGLLRLVEQGRIDLDAPVQKYVPDFPVKPEGAITTRLLAGHLAGIRDYRNREPFLNRPFAGVRAELQLFADDPLIAPPGTRFSYASLGWVLISAVMESAAHRDFLDFMAADVCSPLGLNHTRPDRTGAVDPDRTSFYATGPDGKFVAAPAVDLSSCWAAGGFLSTAEDLVRFGSAMLRPGYLTEDSRRLLFAGQKTTAGEPTGYGIGWYVRKDGAGRTLYYHDGASHGGTAVLFLRPETRAVAAILCNLSDADIADQSMRLADLFATLPAAAPERP
mgnify:CR=1 FL=1